MADKNAFLPKLLIVWENRSAGKYRALKAIRSLRRSYEITLCVLEEDAQELEDSDLHLKQGKAAEDIEVLLSDVSVVLLPMVSDGLLQEIEAGHTENLLAAVLLEALFKGIAVKTLASGQDRAAGECAAVRVCRKRRRQLLEACNIELWEYDLNEAGLFGIKEAAKPVRRRIITQEDVLLCKTEKSNKIELRSGDRITPLAADTARDLGIELVDLNEREGGLHEIRYSYRTDCCDKEG